MSAPRSEETKRKISESVRLAHAENPRSEASREKISAGLVKAHREGRAGGYTKGNKLTLRRGVEDLRRCMRLANQACLGKHGFGRMHIGRPDHACAKHWVVESPDGVRYEFDNLQEWCRANEHLLPVCGEKYRKPLWQRAADGISSQTRRETSRWRGWQLVTVGEQHNPSDD